MFEQIDQCSLSALMAKEMQTCARFTSLRPSMFIPDVRAPHKKFPKLKGRGAELLNLIPVMHRVFERLVGTDLPLHRDILSCLWHQDCIQRRVRDTSAKMHMDVVDVLGLQQSIDEMLAAYSRAALKTDEHGWKIFPVLPKHHWAWHWGRKSSYMHPSRGSCWLDDNYMGVVKHIVQTCARGRSAHMMPIQIAEKIRWSSSFEHHVY